MCKRGGGVISEPQNKGTCTVGTFRARGGRACIMESKLPQENERGLHKLDWGRDWEWVSGQDVNNQKKRKKKEWVNNHLNA